MPELKGVHAEATWWHVITQTSGFDYPYDQWRAYRPGEIWTYSDENPASTLQAQALARVYGKKDFHDDYGDIMRQAYFDAIGLPAVGGCHSRTASASTSTWRTWADWDCWF